MQKVLSSVTRLYVAASRLDRFGMGVLRLGLVIVLVWIGGLKFAKYEAEGIVPLVSQSPLMSFFSTVTPAPEYRQYMNREGELKRSTSRLARVQWHLHVFPRTRHRHYPDWCSDRASPRAATGCRCRESPTHFYWRAPRFSFLCHYTRGMGAGTGRYDTRFSILVRCRKTHRERLHHARGSGYDDGRLCRAISLPTPCLYKKNNFRVSAETDSC